MAKKYVWSIVLRPNPFTQDNDRDQLADVVPAAAKRDEDIADAIVAEGSEIKKETILNENLFYSTWYLSDKECPIPNGSTVQNPTNIQFFTKM